jgi:hypothetical protein
MMIHMMRWLVRIRSEANLHEYEKGFVIASLRKNESFQSLTQIILQQQNVNSEEDYDVSSVVDRGGSDSKL